MDGHVISGRITFTVNSSPIVSTVPTTNSLPPSPSTTANISTPVNTALIEESTSDLETTRAVVRFGNYVALILILGMLFTEIYLANGALSIALGRQALWVGLSLLTITSLAQTAIFIHESSSPGASWISGMWNLFDTTPGSMLFVKVLASILCCGVIAKSFESSAPKEHRNALVYFSLALYLITMSYLGHSRSQDLPWLGIPIGALHSASIAIWIGGLLALIAVVVPNVGTTQSIRAFKRFSSAAERSVLVIVITGFIQSIRLHHDVGSLFTSSHGQLLIFKTLVVLVMVWIASRSRKILNTSVSLLESDAIVLRMTLLRSTAAEIGFAALVLITTAVLAGVAPT